MTIRTKVLGAAIAAALLIPTAGAVSAAPVPDDQNITLTKQWDKLVAYVDVLKAEKNTPATPQQIETSKAKLAARNQRATDKVNAQYIKASTKERAIYDKAKLRIKVAAAKVRQKLITQANDAYQNTLQAIANTRAAKIAQANQTYDDQVRPLLKRKVRLQKRLAKATDPVVRDGLTNQIKAIDTLITADKDVLKNATDAAEEQYQNSKVAAQDKRSNAKVKARLQAQKSREQSLRIIRKAYVRGTKDEKTYKTLAMNKVSARNNSGSAFIAVRPLVDPTPTPTPAP